MNIDLIVFYFVLPVGSFCVLKYLTRDNLFFKIFLQYKLIVIFYLILLLIDGHEDKIDFYLSWFAFISCIIHYFYRVYAFDKEICEYLGMKQD